MNNFENIANIIDDVKKAILKEVYPVGSVYMTFDESVDPHGLFGGVWIQLEAGRVLRSTDSNSGARGGADSVKLVTNNIPRLNVFAEGHEGDYLAMGHNTSSADTVVSILNTNNVSNNVKSNAHPVNVLVAGTSANTAVNITPSHITVYMWRRIG